MCGVCGGGGVGRGGRGRGRGGGRVTRVTVGRDTKVFEFVKLVILSTLKVAILHGEVGLGAPASSESKKASSCGRPSWQ